MKIMSKSKMNMKIMTSPSYPHHRSQIYASTRVVSKVIFIPSLLISNLGTYIQRRSKLYTKIIFDEKSKMVFLDTK